MRPRIPVPLRPFMGQAASVCPDDLSWWTAGMTNLRDLHRHHGREASAQGSRREGVRPDIAGRGRALAATAGRRTGRARCTPGHRCSATPETKDSSERGRELPHRPVRQGQGSSATQPTTHTRAASVTGPGRPARQPRGDPHPTGRGHLGHPVVRPRLRNLLARVFRWSRSDPLSHHSWGGGSLMEPASPPRPQRGDLRGLLVPSRAGPRFPRRRDPG